MSLFNVSATAGAAAALSLWIGAQGALAAEMPRYRIHRIFVPGAPSAQAEDINDRGRVTGLANGPDGVRGFVYGGGGVQMLGWLDGRISEGLAINQRGDVAGTATTADGRFQPVLFRDGRAIDLRPTLDVADDGSGVVRSINEAGVMTGWYAQGAASRAFVHDGTQGRFLDLGGAHDGHGVDINDAGTVLVNARPGSGAPVRPALVGGDGITWLSSALPFASLEGWALNNAGDVVGTESYLGRVRGFVYSQGTLRLIEPPQPGGGLYPRDINDRGWIVGEALEPVGDHAFQSHAFVYRDGKVHDLQQLLTPASTPGWTLLRNALAINERGQIVGSGMFNGRNVAYVATPVPEPASLALLLAGLGVVGWAARARARAAGRAAR